MAEVRFVCSSTQWDQCPRDGLPEVAFIGRSNVGKSSLINALVGVGDLAKVSGRPGKTQLINHFLVDRSWYLVDLPGYGFAQVPKAQRAAFRSMIRDYIQHRDTLYNLFQLVDARLPAQPIDLEFMQWAGGLGVPLSLVMTKSDKLGAQALAQRVDAYREELGGIWEELPPLFVTSSARGTGCDELLAYIRSFVSESGG